MLSVRIYFGLQSLARAGYSVEPRIARLNLIASGTASAIAVTVIQVLLSFAPQLRRNALGRNTLVRLVCVVVATYLCGQSLAHAAKVNVFLIGGQSNADGRAAGSALSAELQAPQSDVPIYWATARNGSSTLNGSGYELLRPGLSNSPGSFGPEVTFGRAMAEFYAARGEKVALIKHAQGGTGLVTEWQAGGDSTTVGDGFVYQLFQQVVNAGLASIQSAHLPGGAPPMEVSLEGMIWMQGERDSNSSADARDYEANLTEFIGDIRSTYGADLPFVIGQLSENQTGTNGSDGAREFIRAAQSSVAAALPNTELVVTNSFDLKADNLHFSAAGQQDLGYAFASQLQSLIVPEPSSAWIALVALIRLLVLRRGSALN